LGLEAYVVDEDGKVDKVEGGMAVADTNFDTETIGLIQQALKNLRVKYDENYKANVQSLLANNEEELLVYISQSNKLVIEESNHSLVDTEPFLYNFDEIQTVQENQHYTNLNKSYKEFELEYNKINIIIHVHENFDRLNIASLFEKLTIDNKKLNDYLTSNSNNNRDEIIHKIQEEIEMLIEKEIKDKSNQL